MFHLRKKQVREVTRIAEYMVSGGAFFWSGYATFFFVDKILGGSFFWAKVSATAVGWTINFILQRYWVFKNPKLNKHQTEVTSHYLILSFVNLVIDYFIVYFLMLAGLSPYFGQFASAGFFTVWNYLWYKYWVFPEKFPQSPRAQKVALKRQAKKQARTKRKR